MNLGKVFLEKVDRRTNVEIIGEVSRGDDQSSGANQVANCTEYLDFIIWEAGDTSAILKVAGEAIKDGSLDLVLNLLGEFLDTIVNNSGSLAVILKTSS